jgi:hypothetical protein
VGGLGGSNDQSVQPLHGALPAEAVDV